MPAVSIFSRVWSSERKKQLKSIIGTGQLNGPRPSTWTGYFSSAFIFMRFVYLVKRKKEDKNYCNFWWVRLKYPRCGLKNNRAVVSHSIIFTRQMQQHGVNVEVKLIDAFRSYLLAASHVDHYRRPFLTLYLLVSKAKKLSPGDETTYTIKKCYLAVVWSTIMSFDHHKSCLGV